MQADMPGESCTDFFGKIHDHVFAGGLIVSQDYLVPALLEFFGQFKMGGIAVEDCGVIKWVYYLLFHNSLKVAKIDHHAQFHMGGIGDGDANYGYRKLITVTVNIPAFPIVTVEGVPGFKAKFLGDPNSIHCPFLALQRYGFFPGS